MTTALRKELRECAENVMIGVDMGWDLEGIVEAMRDACARFSPSAPATAEVREAIDKIQKQCAHYGDVPARCLLLERNWPSYVTPEHCVLCPSLTAPASAASFKDGAEAWRDITTAPTDGTVYLIASMAGTGPTLGVFEDGYHRLVHNRHKISGFGMWRWMPLPEHPSALTPPAASQDSGADDRFEPLVGDCPPIAYPETTDVRERARIAAKEAGDLWLANAGLLRTPDKRPSEGPTAGYRDWTLWENVFRETCDELGCGYDNEALFAIKALKDALSAERERAGKAMRERDEARWRLGETQKLLDDALRHAVDCRLREKDEGESCRIDDEARRSDAAQAENAQLRADMAVRAKEEARLRERNADIERVLQTCVDAIHLYLQPSAMDGGIGGMHCNSECKTRGRRRPHRPFPNRLGRFERGGLRDV